MAKTDRCIVRNTAHQKSQFSIVERHNERKNENYFNDNVDTELSHKNIYYKQCENGYEQTFNGMVEDDTISLRGLKNDAKVFDELMFAVNTDYFDRNGGYEYAKHFFAEAYKMAVNEVGGEQYILSAVMHADERNKALSEQLGRDVFQYHLHVVYVPVVQKEVYYRKNNKNPDLAGKLKEVISQVSHSKKWPGRVYKLDENGQQALTKNGNPSWVNSYSLLQDRFFEHMRAAGFTDFERGERGSTAEHLTDLEYKTQQEVKRAATIEQQVKALNDTIQKKKARITNLDEKITVKKKAADTFANIDKSAKKTIGGNYQLTPDEWNRVSNLAKEAQESRRDIKELKKSNTGLLSEIATLKKQLEKAEGKHSITDTMKYLQAKQRDPEGMEAAIKNIMSKSVNVAKVAKSKVSEVGRAIDDTIMPDR